MPEPVFGDYGDFTGDWKLPTNSNVSTIESESERYSFTERLAYYTEKVLDYSLFSMFPYVLLTVIFFSALRFDSISFADLIDIGFLLQCFYFLASIKSFYAKNMKMLSFLRSYNIIVLAILVIF